MKRSLSLTLLVACGVVFALGLLELFKLRFEAGDVYPAYSSLRADPLGTMAFYESLDQLPGLSVRRDFSAQNALPPGRDTTYLHLAAGSEDWVQVSEDLAKELDGFVGNGGRLAITFHPEHSWAFRFVATNTAGVKKAGAKKAKAAPVKGKKPAKPVKTKPETSTGTSTGEAATASVRKVWGVNFALVPLARTDDGAYEPVAVTNLADLALPETLDWHSALVFTNLDASWHTVYARGTNPVVVERRIGRGTLVMATDSYFLSNEAMLKGRHADLLAWLAGSSRHIVFDEAHLGLTETPGVATLMRKYRLAWFGGGLLLVAGLFIWKHATSFVPAPPEKEADGYVPGKEAAAGFVNLLRRNIPPDNLLHVCFNEWTKSLGRGGTFPIARVDRAQAVMEAEQARPAAARDPARAYREICRALKGEHENKR